MTSAASLACSRSVPVIVLDEDSVRAAVRPSRMALTSLVGEMLSVGWVCWKWLSNSFGGVVNAFAVRYLWWIRLPNAVVAFSFSARTWLMTCWYMGSFGVR